MSNGLWLLDTNFHKTMRINLGHFLILLYILFLLLIACVCSCSSHKAAVGNNIISVDSCFTGYQQQGRFLFFSLGDSLNLNINDSFYQANTYTYDSLGRITQHIISSRRTASESSTRQQNIINNQQNITLDTFKTHLNTNYTQPSSKVKDKCGFSFLHITLFIFLIACFIAFLLCRFFYRQKKLL